MGKNTKPFFREQKQAYYCWIDGQMHALGKKKRIADVRYRELLHTAAEGKKPERWAVRRCFDYYLEHTASMKPNTERNRRQTLDNFCNEAKVGGLPYKL
jgi:hypothetical protein